MWVARPWPRLSGEAVAAPSLAVLKARLDGALSTLGWGNGSLPMAGGGWNQMIFKAPSDPNHSVILGLSPETWTLAIQSLSMVCPAAISW